MDYNTFLHNHPAMFSLDSLGISDPAFAYADMKNILQILSASNYVILGGDVYRFQNGQPELTGDSWYYKHSHLLLTTNDVSNSIAVALSYIEKYHSLNGEDYIYSLIAQRCYRHRIP